MSQKSEIYVSRHLKTMAVITLITALVWTGVGIYHATVAKTDVAVSAEILKPIDATLDADTLNALAQRRQLTDDPSAAETLQHAVDLIQAQASTKPSSAAKATINEITPVASASAPASSSAESGL